MNFIKNTFERVYKANFLFTDIDILVYEIETEDVYESFYENKSLLHFGDYPEDSKFFDQVNTFFHFLLESLISILFLLVLFFLFIFNIFNSSNPFLIVSFIFILFIFSSVVSDFIILFIRL